VLVLERIGRAFPRVFLTLEGHPIPEVPDMTPVSGRADAWYLPRYDLPQASAAPIPSKDGRTTGNETRA
jgi:hypothetical protein